MFGFFESLSRWDLLRIFFGMHIALSPLCMLPEALKADISNNRKVIGVSLILSQTGFLMYCLKEFIKDIRRDNSLFDFPQRIVANDDNPEARSYVSSPA